jgi:predicted HTH domain antitoxin
METAINLPAAIEREIEALVRAGYYTSKSEAVKDAFRTLLDTKPALKLTSAIELYKAGEVSLSRAAELAGMSIEDFKRVFTDRGKRREIKPDKNIDKKVKEIMEWRG